VIKVETKNFVGEAEKDDVRNIGQERIPIYRFRVIPKDWDKVIDEEKERFRDRRYEKEWYLCAENLLEELEKEVKLFIAYINSNFDGVPQRFYFSDLEGNPLRGIIEVWTEDEDWETFVCSPTLISKYIDNREFHKEIERWALDEFLYLVGAGKYYGSWEYGHAETGRLIVYVGWAGSNLPDCEQIDEKYCGTYGEHLVKLKRDIEGLGEKGDEVWLCDACLSNLSENDYEYIKHIYEELIE